MRPTKPSTPLPPTAAGIGGPATVSHMKFETAAATICDGDRFAIPPWDLALMNDAKPTPPTTRIVKRKLTADRRAGRTAGGGPAPAAERRR